MGDVTIIIDKELIAIVLGILAAVGGLLGWIARTYFKRMDRDRDELNQRMVRDKDEVIAMVKDSEKRSGENFQAINGQLEKLNDKVETLRGETRDSLKDVDKKFEKRHDETRDDLQKLNRKIEKRHRETLNTLINLTLQGGRHEGPGRVKDDSAARLGQHSPRRNDEPSSTRDVEADPQPDAVHNDISMVPVPGSGTEPAHAPGLMHQAAPGPKQAPQRVDETGTEPNADESAETAP